MPADQDSKRKYQAKLAKGKGHRFNSPKYDKILTHLRWKPGEEGEVVTLLTRTSAAVLAWRINQGMYGGGFSARVHGCTVIARFGEKIDGRKLKHES